MNEMNEEYFGTRALMPREQEQAYYRARVLGATGSEDTDWKQ